MKELILGSPVIILFLMAIGLIYFSVIFHLAGQNKKLVANLEKIFFGIFLISIAGATGATIAPFDKLHPRVLTNDTTTLPTIVSQLSFYGLFFFLLISRFRYTLKNLIEVVTNLITKSPFFCLFLVLMSLCFLWSNAPEVTFKATLVYLEVTLFAIYFGKQYSWQEIYPLWRWINIIIVIVSIFVNIAQSQSPWNSILGHKNQFSFVMAQTAVLWLVHAMYSSERRLSIIFFVVSFIAMIKGESGASKVLLVVLIGLWLYLGFVKKLKVQWAFVSVILFMIVSICLTIIVTENIEFIVVDTLNKDLTLTGRTDFWPLIVNKINHHPILGYGISGFWQPWRGADNPAGDLIVAKSGFQPMHSHNGFLDLGLDLGWLGLSLFTVSFFVNVAKGVVYLGRTRLPEAGLPLLLLTYTLMTNLTETGLLGVTSIWFWYVATTTRLSLDT